VKFLYPKKGSDLDRRKTSSLYGNYPLSSYNTWHGGTHIEEALAPLVAISNARVIAYKLPSEYLSTGHECPEFYSNGFVLMQHDYKSPKGQEITFYTLYHHIASKFDIDHNKLEIPFFLSKIVTTIKASNAPKGVRGRSASVKGDETRGKEIVLIPKNHIVTRNDDTLLSEWAKTYNTGKVNSKKYHSYTYTDPFTNTEYKDIHIYSGCLELVAGTTNKYKVTYEHDTNITTGKKKTKTAPLNVELKDGALLYDIADSDFGHFGKGTCIGVIPKETEIKIIEGSESKDKKWAKVKSSEKEYEGYIQVRDLKEQRNFSDDIELDKIVACDNPVKAGDIIGYVGAFGFHKNENNYSSHIELFTNASDEEVANFLKNEKKDGEEDFKRYKMLEGAKLEPYVKSATELKAGTPIRITGMKKDYVRVKVKALVKELTNGKHISVQKNGSKYAQDKIAGKSRTRYKIVEKEFDHVNKTFNNLLTKDTFLYWDSKVDAKQRNILFAPENFGKEFWIDKSCLKLEEGQTPTFGLETILESDSCHTYIGEPYEPHERGNTFKKEIELSGKPLLSVTDDDGKLWYFIAESYDYKKECYQHVGWIKSGDTHLELINPFVWSNFGFKTYDAGSEYVYAMKDYHKSEKTDVFIDELWKMVDEDGDGILNPIEFLRAQRNPYTSERMGKMVVKHKSEWSYDPEKIKSEALEFYKLGIDLEEDPDKKKILEQKRDTELDLLVEKTKNLMFWKELQSTTYTPKTTEKDKEYEKKKAEIDSKPLIHPRDMPDGEDKTKKQAEIDAQKDALDKEYQKRKYKKETRKLPSTDMLWHFNVNSFVRQMRAIYPEGGNLCESLTWGEKLNCTERKKVIQIAEKLNLGKNKLEGANWLMAVMALETEGTFNHQTDNGIGYVGLIQFGAAAASDLKTTTKKLVAMSRLEQLDYVEKWIGRKKDKIKCLTDVYLSVLLPNSTGKGNEKDHVLWTSDREAYYNNPAFHKEKEEWKTLSHRGKFDKKGKKILKRGFKEKGTTYMWEVTKEIERWYADGDKKKNDCKEGNCSLANEIAEGQICPECNKTHVDLRGNFNFKSQTIGSTNCGIISRNIIQQKGISCEGYNKYGIAYYQLALENNKKTALIHDAIKSKQAIEYINKALANGHPVRAGVNHTFGNKINEKENPTTDHYVVIVGRKCIEGEIFYQYWDVGTIRGKSEHYRFRLDGNKLRLYADLSGYYKNS